MTKEALVEKIIADLGANYSSDDEAVLTDIVGETITDALQISNRKYMASVSAEAMSAQLDVLAPNIRKAVKSIYLMRGAEDVKSMNQSGLNASYENAVATMRDDIIKSGKRVMA